MRIFKNRLFHKWVRKIGLLDKDLKVAVGEIVEGLYDAKLGGYLYKKLLVSINKANVAV